MKNFPDCFRLSPTLLLGGLVLAWGTGCSSPASKYPYNVMSLSEVRQSSTGQLALIFNTAPEWKPGQRAFLPDENTLNHCISTALQDIKDNPGHRETFSGGLIMHRNLSLTQPGTETFWIELDPFALDGTWLPPLNQPALPSGAVAAALPASFNPLKTLVTGNENFIWQTIEGPFDATVSRTPLFEPNRRDTLTGKAEAVLAFTSVAVVVGAMFAVEVMAGQNNGPALTSP